MSYTLSEEQRSFQQTAQRFAASELAPHAADWDRDETFPKHVFKAAAKLGFMGMYIDPEDHGIGLNRFDSALVIEALAKGCTSTAAYISIHNMAFNMLSRYGQQELRETWSAALASGEKLASYCLTEPEAGSDAASLKTRAERQGDVYIVNGAKAFISGAGDSDLLVSMVRTGEAGPKGISCLAIPADLPGIHFGKKEQKLGWNSQPTRTISFDNVKVPSSHLLANEGDGFKLAMEGLDGGRINIAACSLGAATAALEASLSYTSERKQFGKAISEFQNTQFKLADMFTELTAARQMVRLAAHKLDSKEADCGTYCAMAKRFATDIGFRICDEALQLHGGYGYIKEYPIERYFRDTRVHRILEGTNEIMRLIIARRLLSDANFELMH